MSATNFPTRAETEILAPSSGKPSVRELDSAGAPISIFQSRWLPRRGTVDPTGDFEVVVVLELPNRTPRPWSGVTVDIAAIVAVVPQGPLHVHREVVAPVIHARPTVIIHARPAVRRLPFGSIGKPH